MKTVILSLKLEQMSVAKKEYKRVTVKSLVDMNGMI